MQQWDQNQRRTTLPGTADHICGHRQGENVMNIDQKSLASRLKDARITASYTQEQVAKVLQLPRTAIVQFESGNRAVSTLELAKLAQLYSRPIASFFDAEPQTGEDDVLVALFRAAQVEQRGMPWQSEVSRYLEICRAGVELEHLLERPPHVGPPSYDLPQPRNVMDAVEQGNTVAEQERRRLSLGHNPISDMSDLINSQNIWASGADLPDDMSGLFLKHSSIGLFILVNFGHPRARKRFSYAHEYAHALLDRKDSATVSREANRRSLSEVRANAFAAAFLLPRTGVWSFLNSRFKAGPSLVEQTVYDPSSEQDAEEVKASRRAAPRSQVLTFEDIAALAHHFGVSYQAALFRLKSLSVVNEAEFNELRDKEHFGKQYLELLEVLVDLEGHDQRKPDREIVSQVVHLALEAYRREEISKGKLRDLSAILGFSAKDLLTLAEAA
jgi:Zn-dependent peptidase ImmA (M78 family)/transcriptional regulator with XRE-family HTH domain